MALKLEEGFVLYEIVGVTVFKTSYLRITNTL